MSLSPSFLIADDDPGLLAVVEMVLRNNGFNDIVVVDDSRNVIHLLEQRDFSLVFLDLMMPHISGRELLPKILHAFPDMPVIVITAWEDVTVAVDCMKAGAFDLQIKPINPELLMGAVERALRLRELARENSFLKERLLNDSLQHADAFEEMITSSKKIRAVMQYIEVIAPSDEPVLITGETGAGKELVARAIARISKRPGKLVTVNVAGLDETVFADTLFGHRKGAFTGADQPRDGLVATAENGTLFLDEIGDLCGSSQVKLLRLIQEKEYYPVGSDVVKKTNARIMVATNRDLSSLIAEGRFRKDLYYRLCAHRVHIPALREHAEDIPFLLEHFVERAAASVGKKTPSIAADVAGMLSTYRFDGNVRELQAMVHDAVVKNRTGTLTIHDFSAIVDAPKDGPSIHVLSGEGCAVLSSVFGKFPTLREAEDFLIDSAMQITKKNQRSAAILLGIARQTLSKRLASRGTATRSKSTLGTP